MHDANELQNNSKFLHFVEDNYIPGSTLHLYEILSAFTLRRYMRHVCLFALTLSQEMCPLCVYDSALIPNWEMYPLSVRVFTLTHSERDALCVYFCVGLSFRPLLTLKIENVIWFSDNDLISRSSFRFLEIRFDFWKLIWSPGN